jgi:hypothetical protein
MEKVERSDEGSYTNESTERVDRYKMTTYKKMENGRQFVVRQPILVETSMDNANLLICIHKTYNLKSIHFRR